MFGPNADRNWTYRLGEYKEVYANFGKLVCELDVTASFLCDGNRKCVRFRTLTKAENVMNILSKATLIVGLSLIVPTVAIAQEGGDRRGPPTAEMAAELGVSAEVLENCSQGGRPGGGERPAEGEQPERPSREEHEARLTEMASCLSVTPETLDEVMQEYRPVAPDRG
jgi:hypothetical protein